jgi:DNA invertase Pin-like site-specific DNA recombinase
MSPELQRKQIAAYARAHGHEVVEWFKDIDESGAKASRPEFDEALALVETKDADGLIVAKLDRFMRSLVDALKIIGRIDQAGGQLISVSDNFDDTTPMGRFARDMILRLGQLELERITEGWRIATDEALDRGAYIGPTPTGYRRNENGGLEPDERILRVEGEDGRVRELTVAELVHEVFVRRARGESWTKLADYVTGSGLSTPFGNTRGQSIKRIVANVAYLGICAMRGQR